MEEVQRVRLQDLPVVDQAAHPVGGRGQLGRADDHVHRLGRREMMRDRADAAQALHEDRHLPVRPPLDEFLEAAEFDDVQARLPYVIVLVQQQRHLAVPLDPAHRFDHDAPQSGFTGGIVEGGSGIGGHGPFVQS